MDRPRPKLMAVCWRGLASNSANGNTCLRVFGKRGRESGSGLGGEGSTYVARFGIPVSYTLVWTTPQLLSPSFSPLPPSGLVLSLQPSSMASSSSSSPELPLSRSTNNNDQSLNIDHKLHEVLEDLSRFVVCVFCTRLVLSKQQSFHPQSPRYRARFTRTCMLPSRTSVSVTMS